MRGIAMLLVLGACADDATTRPTCELDGGTIVVTGEITQGAEVAVGAAVSVPHKIVTRVDSEPDILITRVDVGGVSARRTTGDLWEADLFPSDLDENREEGQNIARVPVTAYDYCGNPHLIDTAVLPVGTVRVSGLELDVSLDPECSVPTSGAISPLIHITADPSSLSAAVTLRTSLGTIDGAGSEKTLTLRQAVDGVEATAHLVPGATPGLAILTASGDGSSATPETVQVVAPPSFTGPSGPLARGIDYTAFVTTLGNLDRCLIQEVIPAASTVTFTEPPLGEVTGTVLFERDDPLTCGDLETASFTIRFAIDAPDGSAVVVRCFDTHGASQLATFSVATAAR